MKKRFSSIRFEGQRQSIESYGNQNSQNKQELKSPSANSKKPTDDDDDVDLFGDDNEEESEQTKQRLAAYAEKKSKSNSIDLKYSILIIRS